MEGGDYLFKDDIKNWIKSFNIDNLQIIQYKTLIPIYCFVQDLEYNLTICLKKYEDIVLYEIYNLIEKDFKIQEQNLFEGSSTNSNSWKVGIIKEVYKSFTIYKKKIFKKIKLKKSVDNKQNNNINKDIICGELPGDFIICGRKRKTNCNSKPCDIICNWERKKELSIIGSNCYKFKLNSYAENNNKLDEDIEIEWILEIFCFHSDFLISYDKNNYSYFMNPKHYFSNCDCFKVIDFYSEECYYNKLDFTLNEENNWKNNKYTYEKIAELGRQVIKDEKKKNYYL